MNEYEKFGVTREESNLYNGIKIVLFHKRASPVTTYAVLKSGSVHDPISMSGAAHFLEHMIVNGSAKFPSKDLLAEHIESIGGSFGAMTGQDPMWVMTEVSDRSDYARAADIFNATLCEPLIAEKAFHNEKQVVVKEIQRNNSDPKRLLGRAMRKLFFADTPYEHDVVGEENSILGLDYEESKNEHKKLFDRSRITFIVAGDISMDEVLNHLNNLNFLSGIQFEQSADKLNVSNNTKLAIPFDAPQTHIYFGVESPKVFTKEWTNLALLADILAGGRASRLMKRLRYDKGLIYSIGSTRMGGLFFGSWGIVTDTTQDKVQKVINEMIGELKDLQEKGIKESELNFVRDRRMKSLKRSLQTSEQWLDFHAMSEVFSPVKYDLNIYMDYLRESSIFSIQEIVKKYLMPANWKLAMCGKTKEEDVSISW